MRRFAGVAVPDGVRAELLRAVAPIRARRPELAWTDPDGWHVTLAFLGEVEDEAIGRVLEVMAERMVDAAAPETLSLGEPGTFDRRALWIGVDDDPPGALAALGEWLQEGFETAGLPVQRTPVRPHVTLARHRRRAPVRAADLDGVRVPAVRWKVDEVVLWRSQLGSGPARYLVDGSVPVGS